MVKIMKGINYLLWKAQSEQLDAVTSILQDARQSIAWWEAYDSTEKLSPSLAFDNGIPMVLDFLVKFLAIKDGRLRDELLRAIGKLQLRRPLTPKTGTGSIDCRNKPGKPWQFPRAKRL